MNSHAASRVPAKESAKAGARPVAEGRNGVSATPPSYGIAFLDEALPGVASARHMRTHELQSNPVVQERLGGPSVAKRRESAPPSETRTGLPEDIKSGVESLSGLSMDNVTVHYNSSHPARINALAYTQGTDIHVAPGQERHLPHEAWHVAQQARGRVQPTRQLRDRVAVNDDAGLEREASVMGRRAELVGGRTPPAQRPAADVAASASGRMGLVQRVVVDDRDKSKLLDRFDGMKERAQVIAGHIYATAYRQNPFLATDFNTLFDKVQEVLKADNGIQGDINNEQQSFAISQIAAKVSDRAHGLFLPTGKKGADLPSHKDLESNFPPFLAHYNFFDKKMLWRFTSLPSTEQLYIKDGTSWETVVKVVAAHSGGNDKSNPDVKTLSFGRNPGAFMGVAASSGGDKHVLNIIDKAEYLYGIDIDSLAGKGITAHAAMGRMISLFESEYVLVSTPGFPAQNLEQLATHKYANPFKGHAIQEMLTPEEQKGSMQKVVKEMGYLKPEVIKDAKTFDPETSEKIFGYAKQVKGYASFQSGVVQDKEPLNVGVAVNAMRLFNSKLEGKKSFDPSLEEKKK